MNILINKNKSKKLLLLFSILFTIGLIGCRNTKPASVYVPELNDAYKKNFQIDSFHNGDSKFWNNNIITSKDNSLIILEHKNKTYEMHSYSEIAVNWLDAIDGENFIVYGNALNQIGICKFDDDLNLLSNTIIMENNTLGIDVNVLKHKGIYYLTVTSIYGNVNNADENTPNGHYTVNLYTSINLVNWSLVATVLEDDCNIEDIDLSFYDNTFYLVYEKEFRDKRNSSLNIVTSSDLGKTWSDPTALIEENADNEPAMFLKYGDKWILYYSSDIETPGQSYNGASAYCSTYNNDFSMENNIRINTETSTGILLYDVDISSKDSKLLYAQDYLTDSNLIVEENQP